MAENSTASHQVSGQREGNGNGAFLNDESTTVMNSATSNVSPPPYSTIPNEQNSATDAEQPPAYMEAVKLPSYQEVEDMHRENVIRDMFGLSPEPDNFLSRDTEEDIRVGTDFGFMICFTLSFLLNWIGLLAGYCFSTTIASQYGALSGFGLSLVKWGLLIKHSHCCSDVVESRPWVVWLFIITGWLIFLRGALAYIQIKRAVRGKRSVVSWLW